MEKRSCGACNMGKFEYTPTGRIKKVAGLCLYEIPIPVLPDSVLESYRNNPFPKGYVWPDDGCECPVWAPKR